MRLSLVFLLVASCAYPALAQTGIPEWTEDAFGLFSDAGPQDDRHEWSGLQAQVTRGLRSETNVEADPAYRVLIFTGPKSLVAGEEEGQVAAIALDRKGNLAGSGDTARITIASETRAATIVHGLADHRFTSPVKSAYYASGVTVGPAQSNRAMFRVNSDVASMTPRLRDRDPTLTPETMERLTTDTMTDRFGNSIEDGVALPLRLDQANGFSLLTATTAKGSADANVLIRGIYGSAIATASLGGKRSAALPLDVRAIEGELSPVVRLTAMDEIAAMQAVFGPLVTDMGFVVSDGTEISLDFEHDGRAYQLSGWARDGFLSISLPLPTAALPLNILLQSSLGLQRVTLSARHLAEPGASEVAE